MKTPVILPGATLGILGGGQLGRMFALEAKRMGYRVAVLEPSPDSPCGQVADQVIAAPYDDRSALAELAAVSAAITYEFENVAAEAVEFLEAQGKPVRPGSRALRITQDRWLEKSFLRDAGLPVTAFGAATTAEELSATLQFARLPGFLKTTRGGYDGKGQVAVATAEEAEAARQGFQGVRLIYEEKVDFASELSVIACRGVDGQAVAYAALENEHRRNILHKTIYPGRVDGNVAAEAHRIALALGEALDFVGTYCVELFAGRDGRVLVNEIAPRPHNSGHFSLDACTVSQFEGQVRALCGLPLAPMELLRPAVMLNLVGDGRGDQLLGVPEALALPGVHLHLYGKSKAPKGRKMGHVTVTGTTLADAMAVAEKVERLLRWG
jgi:5-(carboxyamino)imidazole ribonucleotide synthase